jgi:[citrate (pro-3S)-lyase] ligase
MIKEYCDKFDNIKVLTGSDFIGSPFTITAYYNKKYDMKLNAVEDVLNFKEVIIPVLDIDIRFMGEEKKSVVTNDLNTAYIEFMSSIEKETRVIPRLSIDDEDVSASRVRRLLLDGDYKNIKKLVPEHVFEYLKNLCQEEFTEG